MELSKHLTKPISVGILVGLLIVTLNTVDALITHVFVFYFGLQEASPAMNYTMFILGEFWIIPKIAVGLFAGVLVGVYWDKHFLARLGGCIVLLAYSFVMLWHLYGLCYIN